MGVIVSGYVEGGVIVSGGVGGIFLGRSRYPGGEVYINKHNQIDG